MHYLFADDNLYADTEFFWPASITLFGETVSFSDFVSTLLLLTCSLLSLLIFLKRQKQSAPGAIIWALMSVGLFFLAQDEFFSFHENFDKWIHELTGMQKTEWTTQIDTLVLLSYVVVAIGCLWRYNAEIRECSPYWKLFLVSGFCVAVTAMLCDGFANLKSTHRSWFGEQAAAIFRFDIEMENACELGAELLFVMFFASTLLNLRSNMAKAVTTPPPL